MEERIPGATAVGITCKDGVILASEKRIAYGRFVLSKAGKKVFKITDNIGAACAGLTSDMQMLVREVESLARLYELEHYRSISAKSVAKLMSNLLSEWRLFPLITQTIVGGVDDVEGPSIYSLDPLGSVIKDKYTCVGSGAQIAMGMLEAGYRDGMSIEEAKELVIKTIKASIARDAASGNGIDLLILTKNEVKEETIPL